MKKHIEICRFCLESYENMYDMFAENSKDGYFLKITQITGSAEPEEFSLACFNCLRLLEISWKFRIQAQSSHDFLKKIIHSASVPNVDSVSDNNFVQVGEKHLVATCPSEPISLLVVDDCRKNQSENSMSKHTEQLNSHNTSVNQTESKTGTNWSIEIKPLNSGLITMVPLSDITDTANTNNERIPIKIAEIAEVENIEFHRAENICLNVETTTDKDHYEHSPDGPPPNDIIIDEPTNDEALTYYEQPVYSDCRTTVDTDDETILGTRQAKNKSKKNIFVCDICDRTFTQAGNLYTHKLTHSGVRGHSCNICHKQFKFPSHLKNHQYTHQERRFSCEICNAKFHKHSYLKTHQRQHSGEKPYNCECGKSFNNLSNYKSHQRIHTGEKKFACNSCGKKFTQSSSCLRHERKTCNKSIFGSSDDFC